MRRWNGWGDCATTYHIPDSAWPLLVEWVGASTSPRDATFEEHVAPVPESDSPPHNLITTAADERLYHARGQSLPDWVALRTDRIDTYPAGVAYPETEADIISLFAYARQHGFSLIPYGGGTSVVGHINPLSDYPPVITVDLSRMNDLLDLDQVSHLARFGAGINGPQIEQALSQHGYTLGHFPQSFELSTLGGWIATRSSGQQSLHFGRIEDLFIGGRLVAPGGTLDMLPLAASAAGPDMRHMVAGSEGRMGIISEATVRIRPLPEDEIFAAAFFPTWEQGVKAVRTIRQAGLPLSMLRLSDPVETETNLTLAGHESLVQIAHTGLGWLGQQRGEKCMLLMAFTGTRESIRFARQQAMILTHRFDGMLAGTYMGEQWRKSRFKSPYLRNELWEMGYAVDTLETLVPWQDVISTHTALVKAIHEAAEAHQEKVHVFAHLSHLYESGASIYVTYLFRVLPDPDQMLALWNEMKDAASREIVRLGGTISHQHGVGYDHKPYLEAEKGASGMQAIQTIAEQFDPDGILNPGKLF